jgi:hypothetical protein
VPLDITTKVSPQANTTGLQRGVVQHSRVSNNNIHKPILVPALQPTEHSTEHTQPAATSLAIAAHGSIAIVCSMTAATIHMDSQA